jgi:hypothetical protein
VIDAAVERFHQNVAEAAEYVRAAPAEMQQALLDNMEASSRSVHLLCLKGRDGTGLKLGLPEFQRKNENLKRKLGFREAGHC